MAGIASILNRMSSQKVFLLEKSPLKIKLEFISDMGKVKRSPTVVTIESKKNNRRIFFKLIELFLEK